MTLEFPTAKQITDILALEKKQAEAAEQAKIETLVKDVAKQLQTIMTNPWSHVNSKCLVISSSHLNAVQAKRFFELASNTFEPSGYKCKLENVTRNFVINWE